MVGQSLPGLSVSLSSVGVSLLHSTSVMAWSGESLFGVGVSLVTAIATASGSGTLFQFNSSAGALYVPLMAGFV